MDKPKLKLTILIPVRNEGGNIKVMLKILKAVINVSYEALIVYDSYDDDAISIVQSMQPYCNQVKLVYNNFGKGVVNAIKAGIKASSGEYILLLAVDDLGPVIAIEEMISLLDEGCDLVSCTRYAYGGRRLGGSFTEGVLSRFGNELFRILSGSMLTDATTGLKLFRKQILDQITLESNPVGWAVVFELAIKAQLAGMRIGEVPVVSIDRLYGGKATFSLVPWFKEYLRWFLWGVKNLRRSKNKPKIMVKMSLGTIR